MWSSELKQVIAAEEELRGLGELDLDNQLDLIIGEAQYKKYDKAISSALLKAAKQSGHWLTRRNITRKVRTYVEMVRVIARRKASGFYWTLAEEKALAQYLHEHETTVPNWDVLATVVPTRSRNAIKVRLQGDANSRILSLISELDQLITAEAEAAEEEEEEGMDDV